MSTQTAERRTGWALPPRPPEQWLPSSVDLALVAAVVVALAVPLLAMAGEGRTPLLVGLAHGLLGAGAAVVAYVLAQQATVTGQRRLLAAAGVVVLVLPLALTRVLLMDGTGGRPAALRLVSLVAGVVALGLAVRYRGRRGTPEQWMAVGLLLAALAGLLLALPAERGGPLFWSGQAALALAGVVPATGLALQHGRGYRRQARRWGQLVADVATLRAASPLLPGLSISPEDDEGLPDEPEVQRLVDSGRVDVALQPVVRLGDDAVVGFEALSRFGGRVPTDRWFRAASRWGLGGALEQRTLAAALALLPGFDADLFLAVNISPAALEDEAVLALLRGADLSRVVVEVTEHEAVGDYAEARRTLAELRGRGARIAVDDTGAGFASLRHVLMLQPDVVKLDTSLSRDVHRDPRQQHLVTALLGFAAEVGSTVVAEGIETQEQLECLTALGVHWGQGWHLGVPTVVDPPG